MLGTARTHARRAVVPFVALGLSLVSAPALLAQNDCGMDYADLWRAVAQDTPSETHFFTDVTFSCEDGTVIYADSAIVSPPQRLSQWFGNVRFTEEGRVLNADRATYRSDIDRLDAFGNVSLVDSTGSELDGDNLVYIRGGPNQEGTQLTMIGMGGRQPHATIVPGRAKDSTGSEVADPSASPEPYDVVADRIIIDGNDTFRGEGRVHITRESLDATGRNMVYDAALGELLMAGDAQSKGEGYDLTGQSITVVLPNDAVEGVIARGAAVLTTEDMDLTAPKIHVFVETEKLQRLVAAQLGPDDGPVPPTSGSADNGEGDTRATALTQDFLLLGDSLDVMTPAESLETVVAVGRARGESFSQDGPADENTPDLARNDWLEGDTIIATFVPRDPDSSSTIGVADPGEGADASAGARDKYALDQLVARGSARSLYRMAPSDTTGAVAKNRRALHYVVGDGITISMLNGEVDRMEVSGKTQGFHLEPLPAGLRPDSLTADTLLQVDTLQADTLQLDTLQADTLRLDTLRVDTLLVDPLPMVTLPLDTLVRSVGFGVAEGSKGTSTSELGALSTAIVEPPRKSPWQKR